MPNAWVKIGADNQVTILVARSEMGQDVATSMPMLVCRRARRRHQQGQGRVRSARPRSTSTSLLGGQITGGSTSVRDGWEKLRKAGASARMMLVAAAAQEWGVDAAQVRAENGNLIGPGGKRMTYGRPRPRPPRWKPPKDVPLKPVSRVQGRGQRQAEAPGHAAAR